jgi:hypothetical protein
VSIHASGYKKPSRSPSIAIPVAPTLCSDFSRDALIHFMQRMHEAPPLPRWLPATPLQPLFGIYRIAMSNPAQQPDQPTLPRSSEMFR